MIEQLLLVLLILFLIYLNKRDDKVSWKDSLKSIWIALKKPFHFRDRTWANIIQLVCLWISIILICYKVFFNHSFSLWLAASPVLLFYLWYITYLAYIFLKASIEL